MPTHLDYVAVRRVQEEIALRAERVRQEREGLAAAPAWRGRGFAAWLFARRRPHPRRSAEAPASTR
jgi:GNAT superfamily N-acetyltransferase